MTCGGCGGVTVNGAPIKGERATIFQQRAAMCAVCPEGGMGTRWCGLTRKPIVDHAFGEPCPLGSHPDAQGITTWYGARHHGVPAVACWWLWLATGFRRRPSFYPGCGCLVAVKAWLRSVVDSLG